MKMHWLRCAALVVALAVTGCSRLAFWGNAPADVVPEDTQTRLPEVDSVHLPEWLTMPRAELVKLSEEAEVTVAQLREAARVPGDGSELLPGLRTPDWVPVLRKVKYNDALGLSV